MNDALEKGKGGLEVGGSDQTDVQPESDSWLPREERHRQLVPQEGFGRRIMCCDRKHQMIVSSKLEVCMGSKTTPY